MEFILQLLADMFSQFEEPETSAQQTIEEEPAEGMTVMASSENEEGNIFNFVEFH